MPKGVYPHTHIRPKVYPEEMVDRVRVMYQRGHSQIEIGQALGVSQKVIYRLMRNHGIPARVAAKRNQRGANNDSWKGRNATYAALHRRVQVARGTPTLCERCGSRDIPGVIYEWANLSGRYEDVDDYERMCRSCHRRYDNSRRGGDA